MPVSVNEEVDCVMAAPFAPVVLLPRRTGAGLLSVVGPPPKSGRLRKGEKNLLDCGPVGETLSEYRGEVAARARLVLNVTDFSLPPASWLWCDRPLATMPFGGGCLCCWCAATTLVLKGLLMLLPPPPPPPPPVPLALGRSKEGT